MPANPYDYFDDVVERLHVAVADRIEADPSVLSVPLENIDRWIEKGYGGVKTLEHWRELILQAGESPEGLNTLLRLLRDDGETARHLKSSSPFTGILSTEEVDRLYECRTVDKVG